jgi:hypothetical protein
MSSEPVFNEKGKPIGQLKNGNLVWTCDQYKCTWTNPAISAAEEPVKKKKKTRMYRTYSLSEFWGGLD